MDLSYRSEGRDHSCAFPHEFGFSILSKAEDRERQVKNIRSPLEVHSLVHAEVCTPRRSSDTSASLSFSDRKQICVFPKAFASEACLVSPWSARIHSESGASLHEPLLFGFVPGAPALAWRPDCACAALGFIKPQRSPNYGSVRVRVEMLA